jgi:hypothetical protein
MRQSCGREVPDHLAGRLGITNKVTLLLPSITPGAFRISVPGLNH